MSEEDAKTGETAATEAAAAPAAAQTETKSVKKAMNTQNISAGDAFTRVVEVEGREHALGTRISWYFKEVNGRDVLFSVENDEEKVKHPSRCVTSKGSFTTKPGTKCQVTFTFDNKFSWINGKDIEYTMEITEPEELQEAQRLEEERLEKQRAEEQARWEEAERKRVQEELVAKLKAFSEKMGVAITEDTTEWANMRAHMDKEDAEHRAALEAKLKGKREEAEALILQLKNTHATSLSKLEVEIEQVTLEEEKCSLQAGMQTLKQALG